MFRVNVDILITQNAFVGRRHRRLGANWMSWI